jgi:D-cysteine desulfhydrase family pyridoxal phosphate-dependent enzyme
VGRAAPGFAAALEALPRTDLCEKPSPLRHAPRLSARLGVEVWLKRDDLLGPAMGGNKARKLEYLLADAHARGADCVITCGAAQSNHARLTAACANLAGLDSYLVLRSLDEPAPAVQGNLLLDHLLGARVEIVRTRRTADLAGPMQTLAERLRSEGRRPYVIPVGGSTPVGAAGYAAGLLELDRQAASAGLGPCPMYHASSSGGTQAGLAVGAAALHAVGRRWQVIGVDVDGDPDGLRAAVQSLARETATLLWGGATPPQDPAAHVHVHVLGGYAGTGYGIVSESGLAAIRLLAETEGVFVDPVYTGKALAGLIGQARSDALARGSAVVFWHTGGAPALFAHAADLV